MAKYLPGALATVEVTGKLPVAVGASHGEGAEMSTEETRAELLSALAERGRAHPNWRFGQTMSNLAMAAGRLDAGGVWDLEDVEALAAARRLLYDQAETPARTV